MSSPTTTNQALPNPPEAGTSDIEATCQPSPEEIVEEKSILDIEHVPVDDDPREWSHMRKTTTLWIVSTASLMSTIASNIQNPTNALIERDLRAKSVQISWSLAVFILLQGNFPLAWSAASEIKGRKLVYIAATTVFVIASVVLANAPTIHVLIGMRAVQAIGSGYIIIVQVMAEGIAYRSSAAITISAATLADIYGTHERGTMMGIFFAAPLLGPALGPIIGGCLAQAFGWPAIFYFLAACGGILLMAFIFLFKDTFRIERSLTYQAALCKRKNPTGKTEPVVESTPAESKAGTEKQAGGNDVPPPTSSVENETGTTKVDSGSSDIRLSFSDINPFPPLWMIVRRKNNIAILLANGLVFAFSYCLSYTCTRTMSMRYGYNALSVGIVLLSLGAGNAGGSVIGGRWSDYTMTKMTSENEGRWYPEMRLKSATFAMVWLPLSVIGYGWVAEKHVDVGVVCLMLFLCGFFSIWMYASTMAYVVDANPGRSCSAVAVNSSFRGTLAFITTMVAVPLQDAVGDGWLYTGFAVLVVMMELLIVLVLYKGASWRERGAER